MNYLTYLLKRKNEFQIHSPFVYAFYTKYLKGKDAGALVDLGLTTVVDCPVGALLDRYLSDLEENRVFVTYDMHKSKENEAVWKAICEHPEVVLTLDRYAVGYVFYKKGMEKQNMILR